MLVFPERVLQGDIPNRDFLHLYGPGSLWALAGAFKVFGVSLLTERLFGLAAADRRSCSASTRSPAAGAARSRSRARVAVGADHHPVRAHRAGVGRRGRPRRWSGSPPGRRRPRADDESRARGFAFVSGVLLGARAAVPPRSRRRGRARDARARLGLDAARAQPAARRASRSASSPYLDPPRRPPDRATSCDGHGARAGVRPARRAPPAGPAAVGPPRRLPAARRRRSQQLSWPIPDLERLAAAVRLVLRAARRRWRCSSSSRASAPDARRPDVAAARDAARRRAVQRRASCRRRCSASTPRTSPGSAACRSASCRSRSSSSCGAVAPRRADRPASRSRRAGARSLVAGAS